MFRKKKAQQPKPTRKIEPTLEIALHYTSSPEESIPVHCSLFRGGNDFMSIEIGKFKYYMTPKQYEELVKQLETRILHPDYVY